MKLVYTHWRLRKYTAVAEKERKEQAIHRQMSQRRQGNQGSNDVPFGIRAIESGIEVEGVWISRSNTPEPVSRDSSARSSLWNHVPGNDLEIDLEKQTLQRGHGRSTSNSTTATVRPPRSTFDCAVSAERSPSSQASADFPTERVIAKPPRSRHPPLSYTRYNGNPYILRHTTTSSTLEGLDAIHRASTSIHVGDDSNGSSASSNQSNQSTDDSGPISASAPSLLTGQVRPRPRQQSSSDFELLNSHRMSQAAEMGQLTPRGRRPGQSYSIDLTSAGRPARYSTSAERSDYFTLPTKTLPQTPGSGSRTNPFSTPKIDALPPAVRRSSMPDVTPFAEFCKRTSHDARPESLRSSSRGSAQSSAQQSDSQSASDSAPASPIIPASEGAAEMKLPPPSKRSSFEKRTPQVVRGHGSGFEILRPGSLNPPTPKEHPIERQRAAPPISLQNFSHIRSSSEDSPKKLQKKRRPSHDSTTSSDTTRKSRISLF